MKNIILCLDGTDSKFGPAPYTNLLKLFRLLEKEASDTQICYYQSGIGTSMSTDSGSFTDGLCDDFVNIVDILIAFSLDQHVIEAYKFLIKFYSPGDMIYIYGFSRGSFTARVLSSMIERIGLLHKGLEKLAPSAWDTYCAWEFAMQPSQPDYRTTLIEEFRFTFSRKEEPKIKLLGLFDCVNSVGFLRDRMFPFTSKLIHIDQIRHAVGLDERRCKFKQSLIYPHPYKTHLFSLKSTPYQSTSNSSLAGTYTDASKSSTKPPSIGKHTNTKSSSPAMVQDEKSNLLSPESNVSGRIREVKRMMKDIESRLIELRPKADGSESFLLRNFSNKYRRSESLCSLSADVDKSKLLNGDYQEQWFPGNHTDIGAGWFPDVNGQFISNVPLRWMISESIKLGVLFDKDLLVAFSARYSSLDSFLSCRRDYLSFQYYGLTHILSEAERLEILKMTDDTRYKNCKPDTKPYFRSLNIPRDTSFKEMFNNGIPLNCLRKFRCVSTVNESGISVSKTSLEQECHDHSKVIEAFGSKFSEIVRMFGVWKRPPDEPILGFDGRGGTSIFLVIFYWLLELIPFSSKVQDPTGIWKYTYVPNFGRARSVPSYSTIHWSTFWRMKYCKGYKPENLPRYVQDTLEGKEVVPENELIEINLNNLKLDLVKWDRGGWMEVPDELHDALKSHGYIV